MRGAGRLQGEADGLGKGLGRGCGGGSGWVKGRRERIEKGVWRRGLVG